MTTMTQPVPVSPTAAAIHPDALPATAVGMPDGRTATAAEFDNGQQWTDSLGGVPPSRIIFDPWPGTATDRDLLASDERDKRLCELVDGTLVAKPVGFLESQIARRLLMYPGMFVYPRGLGVVAGADGTLRMTSGQVRLPDVVFIRTADLPGGRVPPDAIPTLPPTSVVQVLGAGNTTSEMRRKAGEYFESGSQLVWRIDPRARTVAVFHAPIDEPEAVLTHSDALDGTPALPGFTLPVADLFTGRADLSHQD